MRLPDEVVAQLSPFVSEQDLRAMRVVTGRPGRWIPGLVGMSAITFAPYVCFRAGKYVPGGPRGLALIAHEAHHITQVRELGRGRFYLRYLQEQFRCGFKHDRHAMELPAIRIQRAVFAALSE